MDSSKIPMLEDELLCSFCREYDLETIYNWPIAKLREVTSEGSYQRLQRTVSSMRASRACPMCQIIYSGLSRLYGQNVATALPDDALVSCYVEDDSSDDDLATFAIEYFPHNEHWTGSRTFSCHRICAQLESGPIVCKVQRFVDCDDGMRFPPDKENLMLGRRMAPQIDTGLLLDWINICDDHGGVCRPRILTPNASSSIWMIDVRRRMLVPAFEDKGASPKRYAALSYVWGDPSIAQLKNTASGGIRQRLQRLDGLGDHWDDIPLTIKDSLSLCERLSIPYLWVDALCIDQDAADPGPDLKDDRFACMSDIYGSAYITIVCAFGTSSWAGLPGVRPGTRDVDQNILFIRDLRLGLAQRPGWAKFNNSAWNTRAWTFQEAALSKRLLVFTEDEVLFLCDSGDIWCESIYRENPPRNPDRTEGYVEAFSSNHKVSMQPRRWNNVSQIPALDNYEKLITLYGHRRMTYQNDAIRAFQGIINALSTTDNTHNPYFYGLPLRFLDCALLFHTLIFKPEARRAGFPSWSWSGWKQEFHNSWRYDYDMIDMKQLQAKVIWYRYRDLGNDGKPDIVPTFYVITESEVTGARELRSQEHRNYGNIFSPFRRSSNLDLNQMLLFEAEVLEIPVARQGLKSPYDMYNGALEFWFEMESVILKQERGDKYVMLDEAWRKSQPDQLEFVAIASQASYGVGYTGIERLSSRIATIHTLLVEKGSKGEYYRVQQCSFDQKGWDAAMPKRKMICLC